MSETTKPAQTRIPGLDALVAAHRANPGPIPRSCVDANGQYIPETPEQIEERKAAIIKMFDEIEMITDETDDPEILDGVDRDIDAGRPHRPLFGGGS